LISNDWLFVPPDHLQKFNAHGGRNPSFMSIILRFESPFSLRSNDGHSHDAVNAEKDLSGMTVYVLINGTAKDHDGSKAKRAFITANAAVLRQSQQRESRLVASHHLTHPLLPIKQTQ
jgi:hypothetical protein